MTNYELFPILNQYLSHFINGFIGEQRSICPIPTGMGYTYVKAVETVIRVVFIDDEEERYAEREL
ncbi:MAG: hypothetical protein K5989_13015 [Lachnospiraceae bacterium]|nr:hypothetical protein [Lachnospiraceae bacterium]